MEVPKTTEKVLGSSEFSKPVRDGKQAQACRGYDCWGFN